VTLGRTGQGPEQIFNCARRFSIAVNRQPIGSSVTLAGEELPGGVKSVTFFTGLRGERPEAIFKILSPKLLKPCFYGCLQDFRRFTLFFLPSASLV
jgi:hypothetical protein